MGIPTHTGRDPHLSVSSVAAAGCQRLGSGPAAVSQQHTSRDRRQR